MTITLRMKLGSLARHAEELLAEPDAEAREFDAAAIAGLLADSEVVEFMEELDEQGLLPLRRRER